MGREESEALSKELDKALEQVEQGKTFPGKSQRKKAWKQPPASEETAETEFFDEPEEEEQLDASGGFLHSSDSLLAAFFIPMILMVVIFALKGIYPFGKECFLRTDMYHQYAPFFSEFQYKLKEGGSLLYSWDIGLGVNFTALYAYYLASPVNWLLFFCPKAYLIEFMTGLIVLKTGLCGLSFTWYLRRHSSPVRFGACYFGIFYALSGYMAAYSWNIMWLDCILLFPVIMYGLERLVNEKKGGLYCISLGFSVFSNYYISIMICCFMVMYYFCLLILKGWMGWKRFLTDGMRFAWYSLLAGAMAGVVLLPEIAALQSTASGDFNFPKKLEMYFSILDMLARHIGNVQTETGLEHWPNLYCGVAVYLFFLLYLACRRISVKEKAVYCGLLLLFYASFSINVLNFIWHGFHYPNSLPCRQSFIYIFLILVMCYRAYQYLEETPKKHVALALWGSIGFVLLAQKLVVNEDYHFSVFYVAILFLALYAGLIYYYKDLRHSVTTAALLGLALVALEAAANTAVTSVITTSRNDYQGDNTAVIRQTKVLLKDKGSSTGGFSSDSGFFRFEKTDARTKNDGAWMNFPSVSLFSSMASADMSDFFRTVGCEASTNAYSTVGSTPVTDSLFSIRYSMYKGEQENPRLSLYSVSDNIYLYENPCTLPLGFLLPDIVETGWKRDLASPLQVQNNLAELLDAPAPFEYLTGENDETRFSFTADMDGEYYISVGNSKVKTVVFTHGDKTETIKNVDRGFLLETGFLKAGETVTLENKESSAALDATVARFCMEGLEGIYEKLNSNPLTVTVREDDHLEGAVNAGEGGTLFLSVPYDEGWTVRVDGEKLETRKILGGFLGAELPPGSHTLTMDYFPKGLKTGALISACALMAFAFSCLLGKLISNIKRKEEGQ